MSSHNQGVSAAAACQNHPRREAIGICVACRAQICSECVTKVDGINHCVACYAAHADRGRRRDERGDTPTATPLAAGAAVGLLTALTLLLWALLEVALPAAALAPALTPSASAPIAMSAPAREVRAG